MKFFIRLFVIFMCMAGSHAQTQTAVWKAKVKADPQNPVVLSEAGIACFGLAAAGNDKAGDLAKEYLGALLKMEPRNTLAMVYYGSLMSIFARDAEEPWEKMEYMQVAVARMDKAVALSPENAQVRLVRACNAIHLPAMFNRLGMALSDLAKIETQIQSGKSNLDGHDLVMFYFNYGVGHQKKGRLEEAKACYSQVLKMAPDSPKGQQAKAALAQMAPQS